MVALPGNINLKSAKFPNFDPLMALLKSILNLNTNRFANFKKKTTLQWWNNMQTN